MADKHDNGKVLLLTVGTGDDTKREETLYRPLRLSISKGKFTSIILLPSSVTEAWAEQVQNDLTPHNIQVYPLHPGDEDNADRCFDHFDKVLAELLADGWMCNQIEVDPTRGTKMMSASLVLAAVHRDVSAIRYITGKRDERGMVQSGSEEIFEFRTTRISAARRLEDAFQLFQHSNFAAVLDMIPDPDSGWAALNWPAEFHPRLRAIRSLAHFYGAWDRLNYSEAQKAGTADLSSLEGKWQRFQPSLPVLDWVKQLAKGLPETDEKERRKKQKAPYLLRLTVDLWANGLRRIRAGQWEDATVRAYRILEMVGQMRLFEKGHDSAKLDLQDSEIMKFPEKSELRSTNPDGTRMAGREQVVKLLRFFNDPFHKALVRFASSSQINTNMRNNSVLIHGFSTKIDVSDNLEKHYQNIKEELLKPCLEDSRLEWLELAQKPSFER
ncbi:MAG: TIGR02710 family CRISPR-associated protein [Magnetococcales bacterium]|nr:TIGR02710 family CRISPR-associated protein [Magnetococcales bacterium]